MTEHKKETALTITVIIPAYKPGEPFRKLIRRLMRQTVLPDRILIINTEEPYFHPEDVEGIQNLTTAVPGIWLSGCVIQTWSCA